MCVWGWGKRGSYSLDNICEAVRSKQGNDHVTVTVSSDGVLRTLMGRGVESNQQLSTLPRQFTYMTWTWIW